MYRSRMTAKDLMKASDCMGRPIYSVVSDAIPIGDETRDVLINGDEGIGPDLPGSPAAGAMESLDVGGGVVLALLIAEDRRRADLLDRVAGMTEMEASRMLQKLEGLRI